MPQYLVYLLKSATETTSWGHTMNLGDTSVHIVSDGTFLMDGGSVFGQVPKAIWENSVKADRRNRIRLGLNCLLIQIPDTNILVDTGAGSKRMDRLKDAYGLNGNKLLRELKKHSLTPRDIDIVLLTHLHFDHAGGCTKLDRSGNVIPTFPNADYMVQSSALNEALAPNERSKSVFIDEDFEPLRNKGMMKLLDGDSEIAPGVATRETGGHSNGHQVVLVESGSERIAYVADLIPTSHHLTLPYIAAMDQSPNDTLNQKKAILEMAISGGWLLVFGHGLDQRACYVEERNGRLTLLPVEM